MAAPDSTGLKAEANNIPHSGEENWRSFFGQADKFLLCEAHSNWFTQQIGKRRIVPRGLTRAEAETKAFDWIKKNETGTIELKELNFRDPDQWQVIFLVGGARMQVVIDNVSGAVVGSSELLNSHYP
jgi:hypothetical protein